MAIPKYIAYPVSVRTGSGGKVLLQRLDHEQLRKAIAVLPGMQRKRLVLYYFGGFTYEEIAGFEKCSVHSVYVAVERAKKKLKNFWNPV